MKPTSASSSPLSAADPEELDPADLQRFVDDLYGDKKPTGVVDALIRERRREALPGS